jgi:NADP-dependent 3-hydroxy acid dehydrogenase YdfG
MVGKVAMVAGASTGIGKATAHARAGMGALLVMVGREGEKAKGAQREIAASADGAPVELL